jgi:GNAT superfamily N-acetyltransferase
MVSIREAKVSDRLEVAGVHVRSWQAAYEGLLPADFLSGLKVEDRAARYTFGEASIYDPVTKVAIDGDAIVGFVTCGTYRDPSRSDCGEVYALYVDPKYWQRGVGRELMASAKEYLLRMSFVKAYLWVLEGNQRAMAFYESDGWFADGMVRRDVIGGVSVGEIRYECDLGAKFEAQN